MKLCDLAPVGCTRAATTRIVWRAPSMSAPAFWHQCAECAEHSVRVLRAGCLVSVSPIGSSRNRFAVTYEVVTDESAEHGDAEERGYILENVSLRAAVVSVGNTRTDCVCGSSVEANCTYPGVPSWITVQNGMEFETGAYEARSLHIPDTVTPASAIRIARYLGAYIYDRKRR